VPEEVAVMGIDNHELLCELTEPPLTSVEQGARGVGFRAAELLERLMAGRKPRQLATLVPPERVVARGSTDVLAIGDADVAAALRHIRTHACERIRVADVLAAVSVSRSTLEARFRKLLGRTIHDVIQQTMLSRARQLIVEDNLPLKEVAHRAGFAHVQHLSNVFRRREGRSPGEFRRMTRGE
jgi:LacI family transcriptional regulator